MIAALLDGGADPNATNHEGETVLLSLLEWTSSPEGVALLLAAGADPNLRSNLSLMGTDSVTPLHFAVVGKPPQVIAALLDAGADVEAQNQIGATALHLAASGVAIR